MSAKTGILTTLALIAFAANSILCRLALKDGAIDPVTFTQVRIVAGGLVLVPFLLARGALPQLRLTAWRPPLALFVYAIAFSLAYVTLNAGAGALILFAMVQISMIGIGIAGGARPRALEWIGLAIAFGGLVYLFAPGLAAPPIAGAALMAVAGIAWGIYSVLGRSESDPVAATARNFVMAVPLALLLFTVQSDWSGASAKGIGLAIASGAITSGLGYVIWYAALKHLPATAAAVVQLSVPIVAAVGGIVFLGEPFVLRLALAAALILGGIFLVTWASRRAAIKPPS